MSAVRTGIDAIAFHHTGAFADGLPQPDPDACLGGYRATTEAVAMGFHVRTESNRLPAVVVDRVFGANGEGEATLRANSADDLKYLAPGGSLGAATTVADNTRALITASVVDKALRVARDTNYVDLPFEGTMQLDLVKPFNNAIGFGDVANAVRAAGGDQYRALILRNQSALAVTSIRLRVKPLGSAVVSGAGQLGASGGGTIETAGSFSAYETAGFARVETSGGTLREIVYYTDRTDTVLVVPAAGRALLGTSAAAGAADDNIYPIPGIRIGLESPTSGAIQTIADETTAPTSITWSTAITLAAGPTIASLAADGIHGLWIHREIPSGASAAAVAENAIEVDFVYDGVTYTESLYGLYRVEDTTIVTTELFVGEDTAADITASPDDSGALPLSFTVTPPVSGTKVHNVIALATNAYALKSLNRYQRVQTVDSNGDLVAGAVSDPYDVQLINVGGGKLQLRAAYAPFLDGESTADTWAIYITGDGTTPDPGTLTPTTETIVASRLGWGVGSTLSKLLGPYPKNMPIKVIVRARKASSGAESASTTVYSAVVNSMAQESGYQPRVVLGRLNTTPIFGAAFATETIIDAGNNIRWIQRNGATELWNDTSLVWRWRYDSINTERNGFWTTFNRVSADITGAVVGDAPVEFVDANTLYIAVNGERRMKIDLAASTLTFGYRTVDPDGVYLAHSSDAVYEAIWASLFQVYDQSTSNYVTLAHLNPSGRLVMSVPWKSRATEAEL